MDEQGNFYYVGCVGGNLSNPPPQVTPIDMNPNGWLDIPPDVPAITGPTEGKVGVEYTFTAITTDPYGDQLYYKFKWGDGNLSGWIGPYDSGEPVSVSHTWFTEGTYKVKARAKDFYGHKSDWSEPLSVRIE